MAKVTGGQLLAKTLRQIGATTVFTLCRGHIIDIYNGCVEKASRS